MPRRIPRPSPAMAVALIALVAATGGVGYAQTQAKVDGANLVNRSVSTPKLKLGVIRAPQLATGAVTTTKLKTGSVTARKVAPGAIGTTELTDGGVRTADIGASAIGSAQIADGSITGADVADGTLSAADIGTGAVTEPKIGAGAVTRAKLAPEAQIPITVVRRSPEVLVLNATLGTATAVCAPGERLTGGGAAPSLGSNATIYAVGGQPVPAGEGETPTQWQGYVINTSGASAAMIAFAICARAG